MRKLLFLLLALGALGAGGYVWWQSQQATLPPGFVAGNGRLEATEIDIATKLQGRIAEILVDEGDWIETGQILARMDTKTLQANLRQAEAGINQARNAMLSASALVAQRQSAVAGSRSPLVAPADVSNNVYCGLWQCGKNHDQGAAGRHPGAPFQYCSNQRYMGRHAAWGCSRYAVERSPLAPLCHY